MTDDPKKPDLLDTPTPDDIAAELDEWDAAFDALHAPVTGDLTEVVEQAAAEASEPEASIVPAPPVDEAPLPAVGEPAVLGPTPDALGPAPGALDVPDELADLFTGTEFELSGEPEALGSLLGADPAPDHAADHAPDPAPDHAADPTPTPTPAPVGPPRTSRDDSGLMTSAPRPQPVLSRAPTDDELFGDLPDEVPEAISQRASAGAPADFGHDEVTADSADRSTPNTEATRIADLSALAEESGRMELPQQEATRIADPSSTLLAESKKSAKRGPAIVRREDLERKRRSAEMAAEAGETGPFAADFGDFDDDFGGETKIASQDQLASLVEVSEADAAQAKAAAEAFFSDVEGPAVEFEVDSDFYDDIEIGSAEEEPVVEEPPLERPRRKRRTTAHILRRERLPTTPPAPPEPSAMVEIEAEPSDAYSVAPEPTAAAVPESIEEALTGGIADGVPRTVADDAFAREQSERTLIGMPAPPTPADVTGPEFPSKRGGISEESSENYPSAEVSSPTAGLAPEAEVTPPTLHDDAAIPTETTLQEADVAPDVPPSRLHAVEPEIHFEALQLPEQADPDLADRSEELAELLLLYERELELLDEPGALARMCFEAGRLAERLGDPERARVHYDTALTNDPRMGSALRALRRVARAAQSWEEAVAHIDSELELVSPMERRGLAAHRADLLSASGEQDLARVAVGELLDESRSDTRALLANLELAFVDGRTEEFSQSLGKLARTIETADLAASMLALQGRLAATKNPTVAAEHFVAALDRDPRCRTAQLGQLRAASASGATEHVAQILGALADGAGEGAEDLVAALQLRRAARARAAGDDETRFEAAAAAYARAGRDPLVLEELANAAVARDDDATAVRALATLAEVSPMPADQAAIHMQCASLLAGSLGAPGEASDVLMRVLLADPDNTAAAAELERIHSVAGDVDALIELDRSTARSEPSAELERVRAAVRLASAERFDEALELLEGSASEQSPPQFDARMRILAAAGRGAERLDRMSERADANLETVDADQARWRTARTAEALAYRAVTAAREGELSADQAQAMLLRAIDEWQKVLDASPDSAAAHAASVRLAELLDDADVLERALMAAQLAAPHPARAAGFALRRMGLLLGHEQPDVAGAEQVLREASASAPDDPRLALPLLTLAAAEERWNDAAMVLEERGSALGSTPEGDALRFRAAAILLERGGEPGRAAELLAEVCGARPRFAAAKDLLETAHRRMGDASALAADLDQRVTPAQGPRAGATADRFANLVREAELYEHKVGDSAKAVAIYHKALEIRPGDPLAREGLLRTARGAGEAAPLAELALEDLKRAEDLGDASAKADAYEDLARVDAELRGDLGSALMAWESAAAADPQRHTVLRSIERAYIAEQRWEDLWALYGSQIESLGNSRDAVPLSMERFRLGELLNRPDDVVRADASSAYERDPNCRMALFQLECHARAGDATAELAELERAIAEYFAHDPRARAAFLTRSGETLTELGELDRAIELFRAAHELVPGYVPALGGWRHAALRAEKWNEVAEAAEREAEIAVTDAAKAALNHLAGVALMDKALNGERAVWALRKVLAIDPAHSDAFLRLRLLFDEQGEHEDLAQLLSQRLDVERNRAARVELLTALANLHRNFLDDRDEAKANLRAVLEIDPDNRQAVAILSDIAWEQGAWAEAAQALIGRARLESDTKVLKNIFYRLGTIYTDYMPDSRWALKSFERVLSYDPGDEGALSRLADLAVRTGDWKLALGATDRLLKLESDSAHKIQHLHRMGTIYLQGFDDRARAERAYRVALDVDPSNPTALDALIGFYERAGDVRSMRVHLDRVAAAMRNRLGNDAIDGRAYEVIARAMVARERAGVPGSFAVATCAAELARLAGSTDETVAQLAAAAGARPEPVPGLARLEPDDYLFPRAIKSELRQVFGRLGDRIAKHVGIDVRRYGVGRGERLRRGSDPVADVVGEVADSMGIEQFDVYMSARQPSVVASEPTSPISIVIGSEIANVGVAALRFAAGKSLKLAISSFAVPGRMEPQDLGVLLVALLRQFVPDFTTGGLDPEAMAAEQQRLRRLIPNNMLQELRPFALAVASTGFDYRRVWAGIEEAGNRAGLLASGSIGAAINVLSIQRGYRDLASAAADPALASLMRFAVSEDYAQLSAMIR